MADGWSREGRLVAKNRGNCCPLCSNQLQIYIKLSLFAIEDGPEGCKKGVSG